MEYILLEQGKVDEGPESFNFYFWRTASFNDLITRFEYLTTGINFVQAKYPELGVLMYTGNSFSGIKEIASDFEFGKVNLYPFLTYYNPYFDKESYESQPADAILQGTILTGALLQPEDKGLKKENVTSLVVLAYELSEPRFAKEIKNNLGEINDDNNNFALANLFLDPQLDSFLNLQFESYSGFIHIYENLKDVVCEKSREAVTKLTNYKAFQFQRLFGEGSHMFDLLKDTVTQNSNTTLEKEIKNFNKTFKFTSFKKIWENRLRVI